MEPSSQRVSAAFPRMQERDGLRSHAGGRSQLVPSRERAGRQAGRSHLATRWGVAERERPRSVMTVGGGRRLRCSVSALPMVRLRSSHPPSTDRACGVPVRRWRRARLGRRPRRVPALSLECDVGSRGPTALLADGIAEPAGVGELLVARYLAVGERPDVDEAGIDGAARTSAAVPASGHHAGVIQP